jgi:hypothetical protein
MECLPQLEEYPHSKIQIQIQIWLNKSIFPANGS